jgi:hypothetical protein
MRRFISILLIILLLGLISYVTYNVFVKWHKEEIETARMQLRDELKVVEKPVIPEEKLIEVFGEVPKVIAGEEKQISYEEISRRITAFFAYLDSQEYVSAYQLEGGTYQQFQLTIKELSSNLPLIVDETESLYSLYRNMAHFFRVLGIKRINLIKDVLENESDIIESMIETFYLWFTINDHSSEKGMNRPSLKMLNEYSGYLLNTLSGRSYLLRRHAKVRILTTYYSVLILDKANDSQLNKYGIDIRPHIQLLLPDVSNQTWLINKEQYLLELEKLNTKYQL